MFFELMAEIFTTDAILMVAIGTALGIIIGAIPGLGAAIGITLMIPFTYTMKPISALLLLAGIYMGCSFGGSISGVLLNIPGTAEAIPTTIEGYPLLQKGRGKEALYTAAICSTFGGIIGVIVLIFFAPALARVALKFGPPEMTLVAMIGLTIIASLSGDNLLYGIFGACFGIFLSMVGIDSVTGTPRFYFGVTNLLLGVKQVALALGLIAGREMIVQIIKGVKSSQRKKLGLDDIPEDSLVQYKLEKASPWQVFKDIFKKPYLAIKSTILGTFIGILPGAGSAIASYVAYGEAKRTSKKKFGEGNIEGIRAAECANNAAVGGAFVPMLSLGIPGSPSCALIFSALTIHGIIAGPDLFTEHADVTYGFMYGMLLSVIIMGLLAIFATPIFSKIVKVKMKWILPPVICCVLLGAVSIRNNMYDLYCAVVFMVIGFFFNKLRIPPAPVFLGYILGPLIEKNLQLSLTIAGAAKQNFVQYAFSRPLCIGILVVGIVMLLLNIKSIQSQNRTKKEIQGSK